MVHLYEDHEAGESQRFQAFKRNLSILLVKRLGVLAGTDPNTHSTSTRTYYVCTYNV